MSPVILIKSISLLVLLVSGLAGCAGKDQKGGIGAAGPGPAPIPYQVAPVYAGKAVIYYTFPANIQGEQNVEIRPKVDGFISAIFVDEGAVVRHGQPLFQLNNPQYQEAVRNAAAQVKIAEANALSAKMEVDKVRPLVEKNIISRFELQANEYTLLSRQASLAAARADLVNAQVNARYTHITSPSDGVIGAIPYKVGSLVSSTSGEPLTTVYNTRNVYAYFSLNEKRLLQFLRAVKGKTLQDKLAIMPDIMLVLADGSQYDHKGRVTTASGLISNQTGSATFRATFPNHDGLLRSGSSASVRIPVLLDTAILVPQSATFDLQGKKFVYLLVGKDSISNAVIEINDNSVGNLYVVTKGLKRHDKIVLEGAGNLKAGTPIQPVMANRDSVYQDAIVKR